MDDYTNELSRLIAGSFGLHPNDLISRQKILELLRLRIAQLLEQNPDQLFSMLYRLDISEARIKEALTADEGFGHKIAALIYERQLEKILSRKKFPPDIPDDELAW